MIEFVLIRHGETDWNREGRWQGQVDVPLNSTGLLQARRLAHQTTLLQSLDAIYSSDLARARQTAEILAAPANLPVVLDPRLREIHQGEWQGMKIDEIQAHYGQAFQRRQADPWSVAPPGGETAQQVRQRLVAVLGEIQARYPTGRVAIVSHGFVLAVAQVINAGVPIESVWELVPENCSPLTITYTFQT